MAQKRLTTWQKATALVPLALLSGAWTTSLALTGSATAATKDTPRLPDGTTIPTEAIEAPASISQPDEIAVRVDTVAATASTHGIPSAALAAYQRAAQVINSADESCNLSWQLIAAIGRVESDHGRYGGNVLDDEGRSVPGIFGIPLDGSNGTARITDSDAGQYDDDPVYDRAVGPMQFIPQTWSVVGVDGDGDDVRDPQDIDDAALASAVYLCSGDEDLSTAAGQRAAVYRYNHSQEYVDLVLSIMNAYLDGDFSSVPNGTAAPVVFTRDDSDNREPSASKGAQADRPRQGPGPAAGGGTGSGPGGSDSSDRPRRGGGDSGGTGGDSGPDTPEAPEEPSDEPTKKATDRVEDTVKDVTKPAVDTLSAGAEAVDFCTQELAGITDDPDVVSKCANQVVGMTREEAAALIPNTLTAVLNWLGLSLDGGLLNGGGLFGGN